MNKKLLTVVVAVVVLFGAVYIGSPFWAARQFREAAISGDVDDLEDAVDFPSVRESLKSQVTIGMTERFQNDPEMRSNPFSGLAAMMIPTVVEKAVNAFVTPDGLSAIVKRGKLEKGEANVRPDPKVTYGYDYRSLDRFAVTARGPDVAVEDVVKFVFERRGLFSWKLIRLEIPTKAFAG